jgi:hypothetical protein
MKELKEVQFQELLALASIAEYVTSQSVLKKEEVNELIERAEKIASVIDADKKFFKRLL